MAAAPLAWVRRISSELKELDEVPLFGNSPPFDWERVSSLLSSRFGAAKFSLKAGPQEWRPAKEVKKGLGPNPSAIPLSASPLTGSLLWIMPQDDIGRLTSWMVNGKARPKALSSEVLQEGFYRYLLLEGLDAVQSLDAMQTLSLHLSDSEIEFESEAFCIDVEISYDQKSCWGRLAITPEFRRSWVHHFSEMPADYIPSETARSTMLVVGIKTGSVILHRSEWDKLKPGDFVLLDQGSYDARRQTGAATLRLGPTPLFNVKIKQNKVELLDYAFYYEDTMEQTAPGSAPQPAPGSPQQLPPAEGEVVAIKEMPLNVTVEIARLKITLDQLMHLNPGNLLELPIHPDQGVSLTINGQKVGRAELVYLGEALGIRILEIG